MDLSLDFLAPYISPMTPTAIHSFLIFSAAYLIIRHLVFPMSYINKLPGASKVAVKTEYHNRIVSILLQIYCAYFFMVKIFPEMWTAFQNDNYVLWSKDGEMMSYFKKYQLNGPNEDETFFMNLFLGYFVYDTVYLIFSGALDTVMFFHHAFAIFTCFWVIFNDEHGWDTCILMCPQELTNILMHARFVTKFHGEGVVFTICELGFVFVFIVIRMGFVNWMWWYYLNGRTNWYMAKLGYSAMQCMNSLFTYQVLGVFWKKYLKPVFYGKKNVEKME